MRRAALGLGAARLANRAPSLFRCAVSSQRSRRWRSLPPSSASTPGPAEAARLRRRPRRARPLLPPRPARRREPPRPAAARPCRGRATGRSSATTPPARTPTRTRPGSRPPTWPACARRVRGAPGHGRLLADLPARRGRGRAPPGRVLHDHHLRAHASRSRPRGGCCGRSRPSPTRPTPARPRSRRPRPPPTRTGATSTRPRPTGSSTSSQWRAAARWRPRGGRCAVTLLPSREKIASALNVWRGSVIVTTGGYIGDAPPYQGHVVVIGRVERAHRRRLQLALLEHAAAARRRPRARSRTRPSGAGRGRSSTPRPARSWSPPATRPSTARTAGATRVLALAPDARSLRASYTPANQAELNSTDLDLGSSAPALVGEPRAGRRPGRQGRGAAPGRTGRPGSGRPRG